MASSAIVHAPPAITRPRVGFVVGRYFALDPLSQMPDHNGITDNINAACVWAMRLWEAGLLVFTPHLNTHHFEAKTKIDPNPLENEEYFRAFDRKLLSRGIDFIFATPNWRQSTGGVLEVQVANLLGIPVFTNIADVLAWATGRTDYATITFHEISDEARSFGEKKDMKIVLVDGPYWVQDGAEPDYAAIKANTARAEGAAIQLFNTRIGAFTPHLNAHHDRMGHRVLGRLYEALNDDMLARVADAMFVTDGWEGDARVRDRVTAACKANKPVFSSHNEIIKWRDGGKNYASIHLGT